MPGFLLGLLVGAAVGAGAAGWFARRRRKDLGRFVSFAAHEVNTPITAVNMTILNMLSGVFGPVTADQQPWLDLAREQMLRLNAIVGELRDLVHLELNKALLLREEAVLAKEAVETAVDSVKEGCRQAKIPLEVQVAADAGAVRADPDRLPRTLTSLLFHARKFRSSGALRLEARRQDGAVAFAISFDGSAMTPEEAKRSLRLFYPARAPKTTLAATGTGLGLPRALLRRQGGDLTLAVAGKRHTLTATLPAAEEVK